MIIFNHAVAHQQVPLYPLDVNLKCIRDLTLGGKEIMNKKVYQNKSHELYQHLVMDKKS